MLLFLHLHLHLFLQEYRRCVADWKLGVVTALFDTLHAMCNLLILPPENLRGAAMGDQVRISIVCNFRICFLF